MAGRRKTVKLLWRGPFSFSKEKANGFPTKESFGGVYAAVLPRESFSGRLGIWFGKSDDIKLRIQQHLGCYLSGQYLVVSPKPKRPDDYDYDYAIYPIDDLREWGERLDKYIEEIKSFKWYAAPIKNPKDSWDAERALIEEYNRVRSENENFKLLKLQDLMGTRFSGNPLKIINKRSAPISRILGESFIYPHS